MRKLVLVALAVLGLQLATTRAAHASCGRMNNCPNFLVVPAVLIGGSLIAGYVGATGYFAYRDLTDDDQTLKLSGYETGFNATFALITGGATIDRIRHHDASGAMIPGALTLLHTTLAIHGAAHVWRKHDQLGRLDPPGDTLPWIFGMAYGANTLVWTVSDIGEKQTRGYGIAELAVNAPFAAGLGYFAYRDLRDGPNPRGVLLGALSLWSTALVYHGAKTAIHPYESPGIDFLGTDLMPAVVSDGVQDGAGVSIAGAW